MGNQKKKTKKITKIALGWILTLAIVLSSIIVANVQTVTYAESRKKHNYINEQGVYCYNSYIYPSGAQKCGVPEYCFNTPGIYRKAGAEGCLSYLVYTVANTQKFPEGNKNNRYLDSYCVAWVNVIDIPKIIDKGYDDEGSAQIIIKYCSGSTYMEPTGTPMISVRMKSGNPNLYKEFGATYRVSKNPLTSANTIAKLVQTAVNISVGGAAAAISETVSWASSALTGDYSVTSTSIVEDKKIAADEASTDKALDIRRSVGIKLSKCWLDRADQYVRLDFNEIFPNDVTSSSKKRKAQVRFKYKISCPGKSFTYEDIYNKTYYIGTQYLNVSDLKSDGELSITGLNTAIYNGKAHKPVPTIKHKETKLIEGTDYTVSYSNNVNLGNGVVTIKGKGKYTGTVKVTFKIKLGTPSLKVSTSSNTATLSWAMITGMTGMEIYRSVNGGSYTKIGTTGGSTFKDSNRSSSNKYSYKVIAYRVLDGVTHYSDYSNIVTK